MREYWEDTVDPREVERHERCIWDRAQLCISIDNCCRYEPLEHDELYCCKTAPDPMPF